MPYDLVIRGGTIVDGTGLAPYPADLAISGDRIARIGRIRERGLREIDAEGHIVTPGFIDGHTHMDAQLNWDPLGSPSCWQGVTTAVIGNCGFTLAPVRADARNLVIRNLERAEDISPAAMAEGIIWAWETFPEFLDTVDRLPKGINYACHVGHSALRTWAMGERAFGNRADPDDLALMSGQLMDGLRAGAVGFSSSRSPSHETADDRPVASRSADWNEFAHLATLTGAHGGNVELAIEEGGRSTDPVARRAFLDRLKALAVSSGAPISFGILPGGNEAAWRDQLALLDETAAEGGIMFGQSHSRGVSVLLSFETQLPFDRLAEWRPLRTRPRAEQLALLRDPTVRAKLIEAAHHGDYGRAIGAEAPRPDWNLLRIYDGPLPPHRLVRDRAAELGKDPVELMIDLAIESDFRQFFVTTHLPIVENELFEVMRHPRMVMTFSDAGAHVSQIVDACIQTHLLAYWAREKQAFTIEEAVRMVTLMPARAWGFADRGQLTEGMIADINVIDLAALSPGMPGLVHDLPAGAPRIIMRPDGYRATIVAGRIVHLHGAHDGALPGRLIRRRPVC